MVFVVGNSYADYDGIVTGWGRYDVNTKDVPPVLQEIHLPIISNNECQKATGEKYLDDNIICTGYPGSAIGPCDVIK